jgi:hypothetical protein
MIVIMKQKATTIAIVAMVVISVIAVVAASSLVSTALAQAGANKVTECHIPPGNPENSQTVTTGAPAVPAHIRNHGDYLGPCVT